MIHTDKAHSIRFSLDLFQNHLHEHENTRAKLQGKSAESLEALFLGTHGSNSFYFEEMLLTALKGNIDFRKNYYKDDPDYIDKSVQDSAEFRATVEMMRREYSILVNKLKRSGTFFSMRSIGHMLWDTSIPGLLGYFAALLYNQNNVAAEASPETTILELLVGNELCKMLGYKVKPIVIPKPGQKQSNGNGKVIPIDKNVYAWGHITCDGSVANLEGLWMARNLKFYPVSLKAAILNDPLLKKAKDFKVKLLNGTMAKLVDLDSWTILNLKADDILAMPENLSSPPYKIKIVDLSNILNGYTVQNIGYHNILTKYLPDIKSTPVSMGPATKHYSWPKGAAILGIGANNMWAVLVDKNARMDMTDLRSKLDKCLKNKIPVMNVVAVIGSTEESAVDPLTDILKLRDEYRKKGLEFAVHADAAWGGYFATMLNHADDSDPTMFKHLAAGAIEALPLSQYVVNQYKSLQFADSITIDPHKAGYVPYPAGGLCYRNSAMRNLVSFTAPVVYHGGVDPTVGVYGVEGSKPGAAASAVYFSHKVIRPNTDGYGKLLGECMFNSKRLYAALVCLNIEKLPFFVVPLVPIPAIQEKKSPAEIKKQYELIRDRIVNRTNKQLMADKEAFELFKKLGGDQTIVTYMYNYYNDNGTVNTDTGNLNNLNNLVYEKFSFKPGETKTQDTEIVVTSSDFDPNVYGAAFMKDIRSRLGVKGDDGQKINFIISTTMNPWLSNTVKGSFIPELMKIIIRNVTELVKEVKKPGVANSPKAKKAIS